MASTPWFAASHPQWLPALWHEVAREPDKVLQGLCPANVALLLTASYPGPPPTVRTTAVLASPYYTSLVQHLQPIEAGRA